MLLVGEHSDVAIRERTEKQIQKKASKDQKAELEDLIKKYAAEGPGGVPSKKWATDEGWFPSRKSKELRLEAFKPWQLRAYGFCRNFNGKSTFFIVGFDPVKKQDDADQSIIQSSGAEALRIERLMKSQGG
ncbi:hypothetical protein [Caulobacter segnis]|uniref:hypothetical protein n=1 Tax=Caulobacter segnis TaxID=88688 RepID=UPI0026E9CAFF|nr:hypothetical protein [Caulobacter segnis]